MEACEQPVLPSKSIVVGRPTTDKRCIFDTKGGMDHHEHARLAAIVSRRRKQLSSLEQQVIDVRRQLEEDEQELARLRSKLTADCHSAAIALRQCFKAKGEGNTPDEACREAGQALKMCRKKRGRDV